MDGGLCWGVGVEICGGFWGTDLVVFFLLNSSTVGRDFRRFELSCG